MKELPVIDNRKKILVLIVIIVLFGLITSIYLINSKNYDLQVSIKITETDLSVLENRLKSVKINNFKFTRSNNDEILLSLKKSSLDKNNLSYSDIEDILLSNHTYEVYLVNKEFYKEISKYIQSNYTYPINFKSTLKEPIIVGKDIEKVKTKISQNNLNENILLTNVKYTEYGKSKNEYISKLDDKKYILVTLLNDQFWSYGWTYPYSDLYYTSHPTSYIIDRFSKIGKDYTYSDIKNIALFSKYCFKDPVRIIDIK